MRKNQCFVDVLLFLFVFVLLFVFFLPITTLSPFWARINSPVNLKSPVNIFSLCFSNDETFRKTSVFDKIPKSLSKRLGAHGYSPKL